MNGLKPHVLCIEDNIDTCTVLRLLLEANGFLVTIAQSWPKAMGAVKMLEFDFILTDLHFDGQDDHITQIRAVTPTTPLAVLSGEMRPEFIAAALASGADHYFKKPDDMMDLPSRIAKLLE